MYIEEAQSAVENTSNKKEGFIKKWLRNYLNKSDRKLESSLRIPKSLSISAEPRSIDQPDRAIQFTVYSASGGRVVETRQYNRKTDRSVTGLYIITSEQNFGAEIDKIITMEALKS
jgi:hypothetical protein